MFMPMTTFKLSILTQKHFIKDGWEGYWSICKFMVCNLQNIVHCPHCWTAKFLWGWFTAMMIEETNWWRNQLITHKAVTSATHLMPIWPCHSFKHIWIDMVSANNKRRSFLNSDTQPQHAEGQTVPWCSHCKTHMECIDSDFCCQQLSWEIQLSGNSFRCSQETESKHNAARNTFDASVHVGWF